MQEMLERISKKKKQLEAIGILPAPLEKNLYEWFKVTLTYTSNFIEGNTLTLAETAQIVEKNLTVSGKTIVEHIEAVNLAHAIDYIKNLAKTCKRSELSIEIILSIHKIILNKINDEWAGKLRAVPIRITGSQVPRPNYLKVPDLMNIFVASIKNSHDHVAKIAADAHLEFVFIHPCVDGNGRTARLIMNLILLQENYPLFFIKAEDRQKYIDAIEKALLKEDRSDYYFLIYSAIEYSLDEYINAAQESDLNTQ